MKNLVIALVVLIAAALLYQQLKSSPSEKIKSNEVTSNTAVKAPPAKPTETVDPLISEAVANARVFIIEPVDGASVSSPVKVVFGIENMTIAPAGQDLPNSGHHHLLIDLVELPALDAPLPASDHVIHFGKGQTETTIELEPGDHSLQLLLGNYLHIPHSSAVISNKILINVTD